MSDFEAHTGAPVAKSDEERAAFFQELMHEERRKNLAPVSGLAFATLVMSVVGWAGLYLSWLVSLLWMACALVFAFAAVSQIRHRERRGALLVVLGVGVIVTWAVYITVAFPD